MWRRLTDLRAAASMNLSRSPTTQTALHPWRHVPSKRDDLGRPARRPSTRSPTRCRRQRGLWTWANWHAASSTGGRWQRSDQLPSSRNDLSQDLLNWNACRCHSMSSDVIISITRLLLSNIYSEINESTNQAIPHINYSRRRTISQKPMHLGSTSLTQKRSTMSPVNPFILGSRGQSSRSRVTKTSPA